MRKLPAYLMYLWLGVMVAQATGGIRIGTEPISLAWIGSVGIGFTILVLLDRHFKYELRYFNWLYFALLIYFVFYNLAIINDWYTPYPFINRIEHLLGGVFLTIITWSLMEGLGVPKQIKNKWLKLIFLAGVVALGSIAVEILELSMDLFLGRHTVGPEILDTNWDLLMDMLGLSLVVIVHKLRYVFIKQRTK